MRGFESLPPLTENKEMLPASGKKRMADEIRQLTGEVQDRTTECDYHKRMADKLAENIRILRPALIEAERFMAYFSGETGGTFVGPGMPLECLENIRSALQRT